MKVYLDNCCYNRPFDDFRQKRIREEGLALLKIFMRAWFGADIIAGSDAIDFEIGKITRPRRKLLVSTLYGIADFHITYTLEIIRRSMAIKAQSSIRTLDSLHIACAESAGVDALLTTDDRFERAAQRLALDTRVMNPVDYIKEIAL